MGGNCRTIKLEAKSEKEETAITRKHGRSTILFTYCTSVFSQK